MIEDLYQQLILDHNASPKNYKKLSSPSHQANGYNLLCGDNITIYLQIENDIIKNISFIGEGCAISKASASIMTEELKEKTVDNAKIIFDKVHKFFITDTGTIDSKKLLAFSGVKKFPMRIKCATLAWHTFKAALENKNDTSTE